MKHQGKEEGREKWNVEKEGQRVKRGCHLSWCERNAAAAPNMYKKQRGQLSKVSGTQYNVYCV